LQARPCELELCQDGFRDGKGLVVPAVKVGKLSAACGNPPKPFSKGKGASIDVASLVSSLRSTKTEAPHDFDVAVPSVNVAEENPSVKIRYSTKSLLAYRRHATVDVPIDVLEVRSGYVDESKVCTDEKLVFSPDKVASKKAISFHMDLEVDAACIVHAYNLDSKVEWPILQTFCTKTVGILPLSIRMMRRSLPARAMIIFQTPEEAVKFVKQVPSGTKLKGRKPRFELNQKVRRGSLTDCHTTCVASSVANVVVDFDQVEFATAVVCEPGSPASSSCGDSCSKA